MALCVLALIMLAPFAPELLHPTGKVFGNPSCDNPSYFYYIMRFVGQSWRAGEVPLWNPYIFMGLPMIGEGQGAAFHPLTLLYLFLPTGRALNWVIALCPTLSAMFYFGYLRALRIGLRASFCGALAWGYSSAFAGRIFAGHIAILLAATSFPLILMLWETYCRSLNTRYLIAVAFAYATLIFSGSAQFTLVFSIFILVYVLVQSATDCVRGSRVPPEIRKICVLGCFIALGVGVAAIQLLPSFDLASHSVRSGLTLAESMRYSFNPEYLLTALCPRFFGVTTTPGAPSTGGWLFWEKWMYFGIIPAVAAMAGVWAAPARLRVTLLVSATVCFVVALGEYTPLYELLYRCIPLFHYFRAPGRYMLDVQFCLIALAAFGLDSWFSGFDSARAQINASPSTGQTPSSFRAFFAGWGFCLTLAWALLLAVIFCALLARASREDAFVAKQISRTLAFLGAAVILLLLSRIPRARKAVFPLLALVLFVDLSGFFRSFLSKYDESITRYPSEFMSVLMRKPYPTRVFDRPDSNRPMANGFSSMSGYAGISLPRYYAFIGSTQGFNFCTATADTRIAKITDAFKTLAIDCLILSESDICSTATVLARGNGQAVIPYQGAYPRAFLAEDPRIVAEWEQALAYILEPDADALKAPVIELLPLPPGPARLGKGETVEFVSFARNRVELRARTKRPRVLVLNEARDKDWRAEVNGAVVSVYSANFLFRAVVVPKGESKVVFTYAPPSFRTGAWVSAASVLALLGIAAAPLISRTWRRRGHEMVSGAGPPSAGKNRRHGRRSTHLSETEKV